MKTGFVDLQVNGWMGLDFSAPGLTVAQVLGVTRDLRDRGTIAYCPTVITTELPVYEANLQVIRRAMDDRDLGRHLLGIHLEGPFISPEAGAVGAHPARHVREPDPATLDRLLDWASGKVRLLTLAPERPGALDLIRRAVARGVFVSLGHHLAKDADLDAAVDAGATLCTHIGNGLPNEIHRHRNPLWWALADDRVAGMFITDGHHLPAPLIKTAFRAKTPKRFIVTSDASSLAGMPPGRYTIFGGLPVVVEPSGRIYSEQSRSLAGSHATMIECMNHLASLGLLTEAQLRQVGRTNPLKAIGLGPAALARLTGPAVRYAKGRFVVG